MATNSKCDDALIILKKQIQEVLKSDPNGVEAGSFWNYFMRIHHTLPDPKQFKVTKRSALLELCSDVIEKKGSGHTGHIRLFNIETSSSNTDDHRFGKSAKEHTLRPAQHRETSEPQITVDTGIESAVGSLEIRNQTMQPNFTSGSFYDKFYSSPANPGESSSQSSSSGSKYDGAAKGNVVSSAKEKQVQGGKPSLLGSGPVSYKGSQQFKVQQEETGKGNPTKTPVGAIPSAHGKHVQNSIPSLLGDGPFSFMGGQQDANTGYRGFYGAPFVAPPRNENLKRPNPISQHPSTSLHQFSENATGHRVTTQWTPLVPAAAMGDTFFQSVKSGPPVTTAVRKVNFSRQQINSAAEDCIDRLSSAKDYVSLEKIEKLLIQHFEVDSLLQLNNLRHADELPCVNEHMRMLCKVNTYIQNFVKVRTVCTLFELQEAMHEFAPNGGDFETLKLGPLAKLPLIYELFKFPSESDICEISTADVIEDLRLYLTEKSAWTAQLNLEELLKFMMEKRDLESPYELGIRIKSPPLVMQMLKKAQRDCGQTVRTTSATLSQAVQMELEAAYRNFQQAILRKEVDVCLVREEYCSMQPNDLLKLIITKLRLLYQMVFNLQISWDPGHHQPVAMTVTERKKHTRTLDLINNFVNHLGSDTLLQKLFKVAVCCSQEQIHNFEFVREKPIECSDEESDDESASSVELPPIGEVIKEVKKYLERVIAQGSITLELLNKIEQKLLTNFNLKHFGLLQQGSFIEFLLNNEHFKKLLDEYGGSIMGSSSHSTVAESIYHAALDDLLEFIRQCDSKEIAALEIAACHHYGCKDIKALGHGSISALLNRKRQHQPSRDSAIFYDSALAAKQLFSIHGQNRAVGVLGHTTQEKALACLQNCPLLADMAEWSHWELVFKPQLKDLKDFIEKHGVMYQLNSVDGARNVLITTDLAALEVRPGTLLRLSTRTTADMFESVALEGNARSTAGHLMSLIALSHGVEKAPLALLGNHVKTALLKMQSNDTGFDDGNCDFRTLPHIQFVLDCLTILPLVTGQLVIRKVFLDVLSDVVGQARSKQLLLQHARNFEQLSKLQAFGMLLGIAEWTESFNRVFIFPKECIEVVAPDLGISAPMIDVSDDESESSSDQEITLSEDESDSEDDVIEIIPVKEESSPDCIAVNEAEGVVEPSAVESMELITDDSTKHSFPDVVPSGISEECAMEVRSDTEAVSVSSCEETGMSPSRRFIELLRHEEFGINVELSDDGRRLMNKQQERLGRSLERLSADLYSKDTHFVLELIQNADDNDYSSEMLERDAQDVPSLKFVVDPSCISVYNNETGFKESNIRAVCDVGKTTKGKHKFGYIGQKGIGFKSVFRVAECPEIHSNGFHIRFDVNSGPLGYILPHWIDEDDVCNGTTSDNWTTCIRLPLRAEMKQRTATKTLTARFRDIQPSLLLFLHRLRSIAICNQSESHESVMRRRDLSDNIVEITHGTCCDRWLVVRKMLDASKISLQAKSGVEIESTELAIAFPLLPRNNLAAQILPQKQPVFAFLPLRSYGFRFIVQVSELFTDQELYITDSDIWQQYGLHNVIDVWPTLFQYSLFTSQGDFDVPSSREEVDRDSMWNQWLRSEIAGVFVSALDSFKELKGFDVIPAVATFLQFVPFEGEILDFFSPVATQIFQQLKAKSCLPSIDLQWRLPSQLVTSDPLVREVVSSALLRQSLNLDYLHSGVSAILSSQMMNSLGVQSLNTQHLLEVGKHIVARLSGSADDEEMLNEVDVISVSKWLLCLHKSMDEFGRNEETYKSLRAMRMIPLSNGCVTSIDDDTVFFPLSMYNEKRGTLAILEADMQIVHPLMLGSGTVRNSQICAMLEQLGVKRLTPRDVISHHILPILRTEAWKSKPQNLVVVYMVYIMEQVSQQPSIVNMEELRPLAVILTNNGFVRPAESAVHFSPAYLNSVDLARRLPGFPWTMVHQCYLTDVTSRIQVMEWRKFLSSLGVLDFLAVNQKDVKLSLSALRDSPWSGYANLLPSTAEEYVIADYQCEEFASLVRTNTDQSTLPDQMVVLFTLLDRDWEQNFKKFTITKMMDKSGHMIREVETSFGIFLKTLKWLPATVGQETQFLQGKDLFIQTQLTYQLLSSHVPYLKIPTLVNSSTFSSFLGIRSDINVDFVADNLKIWCRRGNDPKQPTKFITSLGHIRTVYEFLFNKMPRGDFAELVCNNPVIFYVNRPIPDLCKPVEGLFLKNSEAVWLDPSTLFDKYHDALVASSPLSTNSLCRYILQPVYSDKKDFFCRELRVQRAPDASEFLQLAIQITTSCTVQKALPDILTIFSIIGKHLEDDTDGAVSSASLKKQVDQLKTEKMIPTKSGTWVALDACPMIADDKKLEKLFSAHPEVFYVDNGEKMAVGASKIKPVFKDSRDKDQSYILKFLSSIGVRRLTDCVKITSQTENYRPCPGLQAYVRQVVPWIQRQLYDDKFREIYDYLVESGIKAQLAVMTFAQVGKLELVHSLTNLPDAKPVIFEEKCRMISVSELYVHFESATSYSEINRELSRYFSCAPASRCSKELMDQCFRELKLMLGEIQPLLHLTNQQLEAMMERTHEIGTLPDSEELWEVRQPVIYDPPPRMVVAPEKVEYDRTITPMETGVQEETSGIRSWPPKSHDNLAFAAGLKSTASSSTTSTMWPPPAPPQGISHSQLPANLRPSSLPRPGDSERKEEDQSQFRGANSEKPLDQQPRPKEANDEGSKAGGNRAPRFENADQSHERQPSERRDGDGLSSKHFINQDHETRRETIHPKQREGGSSISDDGTNTVQSTAVSTISDEVRTGDQVVNPTILSSDVQLVSSDSVNAEGVVERSVDRGEDEPMVIEFTRTNYTTEDGSLPRMSCKRPRVNSESSLSDVIKQSHIAKQRMTVFGPPIWLYEVEDCIFEQLGCGESLDMPTIPLSEESDSLSIGQWGELLVKSYLEKLTADPESDLESVIWTNLNIQRGLPYDFQLVYRDKPPVYVEVKSTRFDQKACFGISIQQVTFAQEMGSNYHLYRVYCAGDTKRVRLARIDNVAQRLVSKQLRLFMAI